MSFPEPDGICLEENMDILVLLTHEDLPPVGIYQVPEEEYHQRKLAIEKLLHAKNAAEEAAGRERWKVRWELVPTKADRPAEASRITAWKELQRAQGEMSAWVQSFPPVKYEEFFVG